MEKSFKSLIQKQNVKTKVRGDSKHMLRMEEFIFEKQKNSGTIQSFNDVYNVLLIKKKNKIENIF